MDDVRAEADRGDEGDGDDDPVTPSALGLVAHDLGFIGRALVVVGGDAFGGGGVVGGASDRRDRAAVGAADGERTGIPVAHAREDSFGCGERGAGRAAVRGGGDQAKDGVGEHGLKRRVGAEPRHVLGRAAAAVLGEALLDGLAQPGTLALETTHRIAHRAERDLVEASAANLLRAAQVAPRPTPAARPQQERGDREARHGEGRPCDRRQDRPPGPQVRRRDAALARLDHEADEVTADRAGHPHRLDRHQRQLAHVRELRDLKFSGEAVDPTELAQPDGDDHGTPASAANIGRSRRSRPRRSTRSPRQGGAIDRRTNQDRGEARKRPWPPSARHPRSPSRLPAAQQP